MPATPAGLAGLGREKSIVDIGLFQLAAEANYQREEEVEKG